ncbi:MAG: hypothetical protein JXL80_08850 [Planctomycetes bacterium]|nr:hypothetical protein [Planctomycetota bacterium]
METVAVTVVVVVAAAAVLYGLWRFVSGRSGCACDPEGESKCRNCSTPCDRADQQRDD